MVHPYKRRSRTIGSARICGQRLSNQIALLHRCEMPTKYVFADDKAGGIIVGVFHKAGFNRGLAACSIAVSTIEYLAFIKRDRTFQSPFPNVGYEQVSGRDGATGAVSAAALSPLRHNEFVPLDVGTPVWHRYGIRVIHRRHAPGG